MDRRSFMKLFGIGGAAAAAIPSVLANSVKQIEPPVDVLPSPGESERLPLGLSLRGTQANHIILDDHDDVEGPPFLATEKEPKQTIWRNSFAKGGHGRGDLRGCTITLSDGDGNSVAIRVGEGNLTWTEHSNFDYKFDRGVLEEVVQREPEPVDVTLDISMDWLQTNSELINNPLEIIRNSSPPDGLTMLVEMDEEWYEFRGFFWDTMEYDMNQAMLSLSGRCMEV